MSGGEREDDVALKLLHTADWHLGKRFKAFDRDDEVKLTRARLDVIDRILALAVSHRVDAVLCAGDQFDGAAPAEQWWRGLLDRLRKHDWSQRPLVLLPGNHDPLTDRSVYHERHPFRAALPTGVHVVDREGWELTLGDQAVVYGSPCRSEAGETGLVSTLPARPDGDERLRVGLVHGQDFAITGYETNFPIDLDEAANKGLDYLALGDTHGFRIVRERPVMTVYPGAPEPTRFDEKDPGHVALVLFPGVRRPPFVQKKAVGRWQWREVTCRSLDELRLLCDRPGPKTSVVRLVLDMTVGLSERDEVERLLDTLKGTESHYGRVDVLLVDRNALRFSETLGADEFPDDLPEILRRTVERLEARTREDADPDRARKALFHLWRLLRKPEAPA